MTRTGTATAAALVEAAVAARPDAVAVVYQDAELSYAELNSRANRLAWRLIRRGVGPDSVVALAVPRSPELVVAWLGVLKAGAAYLPIDAGYPADRIEFMLGDTRPSVVVTTAAVAAGLPVAGNEVLLLDDAVGEVPDTDPTDTDRTRPLSVDDAAYVIYTSGSTGTPEGRRGHAPGDRRDGGRAHRPAAHRAGEPVPARGVDQLRRVHGGHRDDPVRRCGPGRAGTRDADGGRRARGRDRAPRGDAHRPGGRDARVPARPARCPP